MAIAVSLMVASGCMEADEPAGDPADPTDPTDTPQRPDRPPAGLRAALVPARSLPTPGDAPAWSLESTVPGEGRDLASVCQRTALASLGATRSVTRQYASGDLSATHVVARFGDDVSAGRTYEVLQSWLGQCGQRLAEQGLEPAEVPAGYTDVPGVGERAGWSWIAYGPVPGDPDAANIEVQALVHGDERLSWVIWRQVGQDYNYPPGQTPAELALPVMADRLP
ncbi:MAG: hypothetical protein M3419_00295 [Actinomycetota bacterium]|nr:hypothetical protein [Actinomycetota bacterium]